MGTTLLSIYTCGDTGAFVRGGPSGLLVCCRSVLLCAQESGAGGGGEVDKCQNLGTLGRGHRRESDGPSSQPSLISPHFSRTKPRP